MSIPKSLSSSRFSIFCANVSGSKISRFLLNSLSNASAAFFRTIGRTALFVNTTWTSAASESANSLPPTFATNDSARH